jgi:hypothetical protein
MYVLELTTPLAITFCPDTVQLDGDNGIFPFTDTVHVTLVSEYVNGNVTVTVSDGNIAILLYAVPMKLSSWVRSYVIVYCVIVFIVVKVGLTFNEANWNEAIYYTKNIT